MKKRDWKKAKRHRNHIISFRVSSSEKAMLEEDIERAGITMGAHLRKIALDAPIPRQCRRPPVEVKQLALLLGHVGKIGSNINQMAKGTNAGLPINTALLREAVIILRDLRSLIDSAFRR